MICKLGNGCQLGVGLSGDQRTERQTPIIAHPIKKQMKGQTSYQLLVVSPEVRKSRVKRKGSREMGMREGKKKDKIVISKLSHALHDSLQTHCTTGPREAYQNLWAKKFELGLPYNPRESRVWDPFLSGGEDVMKLCH